MLSNQVTTWYSMTKLVFVQPPTKTAQDQANNTELCHTSPTNKHRPSLYPQWDLNPSGATNNPPASLEEPLFGDPPLDKGCTQN